MANYLNSSGPSVIDPDTRDSTEETGGKVSEILTTALKSSC